MEHRCGHSLMKEGQRIVKNDEQEIRELVATWMSASKAGDVETVLSLMADDMIFLVPGQSVMRKADFAAAMAAPSAQGTPQFEGKSENSGDQGARRLGFHVDQAHSCHLPPQRSICGACWLYAIYPQEAQWEMGVDARCQHANSSTPSRIRQG